MRRAREEEIVAVAVEDEVRVMGQPAAKKPDNRGFGVQRLSKGLKPKEIDLLKILRDTKHVLRRSDPEAMREGLEERLSTIYDEGGEETLVGFANRLDEIVRNKANLEEQSIARERDWYDKISITPEQQGFLSSVRRIENVGQLEQIIVYCDVLKATCNQMIEYLSVDNDEYTFYKELVRSFLDEQKANKARYAKKAGDEASQAYDG